ncbi:hypothetical protein B0J14DRAFT_681363 [Halenospora varia]|nr:hypothetical protein B0J14DRAFT_681363 [Halenospora varia]
MEVLRRYPDSVEARHIIEWPNAPSTDILTTKLKSIEIETSERPCLFNERQDIPAEQPAFQSTSIKEELASIPKPDIPNKPDQPQVENSPTIQLSERRWFNLGRLATKTSPWPNPQLSTGTKCNRVGNQECWEAIGPAQELFAQLSQSIADLLDARVEDIEEGEPVAGNILTFGMYMIGRDQTTARPALIFTCRRPKPRRRAIKFIKESEILKGYPKISFGEGSTVPMAMGRNYLRLLSGTTANPRCTPTPAPSPGHSRARLIGIGAGLGIFLIFIMGLGILLWGRRKLLRKSGTTFQSEAGTMDNRQWIFNWLRSTSADAKASTTTTDEPLMPPDSTLAVEDDRHQKAMMTQVHDQSINVKLRKGHNRLLGHYQPVTTDIDLPAIFPMVDHDSTSSVMTSNFQSQPIPSDVLPSSSISHALKEGTVWPKFQQDITPPLPLHPLPPTHSPAIYRRNLIGPSKNSQLKLSGSPLCGTLLPNAGMNQDSDVHLPSSVQLHGMAVSGGGTLERATIGGIIHSSNKYYGLTVCHSFMEAHDDTTGGDVDYLSSDVGDAEFTIDSDDEESTMKLGISDATITSQASISSAASVSRISSTASVETKIEASKIPPSLNPDDTNKGNDMVTVKLARPFIKSTPAEHNWALVELSQTSVLEAEEAFSKNESFRELALPQRIAAKPTTDTEVVAIKGYSGISRGTLSFGTSMMKLPHSSKFHEVWAVRFDGALVKGDSGSWVLDAISGDLFGHIVAGIPEDGLAYILPAHKTFRELEEVMGPVNLASNVLPTEVCK